DGDTVTLLGEVTMPLLKQAANFAVNHIKGLTLVIDKIEVLPPSPVDQRIRADEYNAIYENPELSNRYGYRAVLPIHIVVKNRHVTLEGVVANAADKSLVGASARAVPEVASLTNNLLI